MPILTTCNCGRRACTRERYEVPSKDAKGIIISVTCAKALWEVSSDDKTILHPCTGARVDIKPFLSKRHKTLLLPLRINPRHIMWKEGTARPPGHRSGEGLVLFQGIPRLCPVSISETAVSVVLTKRSRDKKSSDKRYSDPDKREAILTNRQANYANSEKAAAAQADLARAITQEPGIQNKLKRFFDDAEKQLDNLFSSIPGFLGAVYAGAGKLINDERYGRLTLGKDDSVPMSFNDNEHLAWIIKSQRRNAFLSETGDNFFKTVSFLLALH